MEGSSDLLISVGAGYVGAIAVGALITGAPIMDIATSVSGAAGAAGGFAVGKFLQQKKPSDYAVAYPIAGAILVPGLAGGVWDVSLIAISGGAVATGMVASKVLVKE